MSADPQAVVQSFFDDCAKGGTLIEALETHCTQDCVWSNTGFPDATGLDAMKGFMQQFIDGVGMHALVVDLHAASADGNKVLTERTDHLDQADGTRAMSLAVAGILEVTDGKISAWRDYFDPTPFLQGG